MERLDRNGGAMEVMNIMNDRSAKARSTRKSRPVDGGRKAKAARPGRRARAAKPRAGTAGRQGSRGGATRAGERHASALPDEAVGLPEPSRRGSRAGGRRGRCRRRSPQWLTAAADRRPGDGRRPTLVAADAPESDDEEEDDAERSSGRGRGARRQPEAQARATTSRRASWRCTSATWRSSTCCVRSRSSRRPATSKQMELDLWRTVLGFAPGTGWVLDVVEREVGKPLHEAKLHRAAAERARRKSSIPARSRFDKASSELGGEAARARHRSPVHRRGARRDPARRPRHEGAAVRGHGSVLDLDQGVRGLRPYGGQRRRSASRRRRTSS